MESFTFEKDKDIVYANRHCEWCKGKLVKDYPDLKLCTVKDKTTGGFYTVRYEDIREYVTKSDRKMLTKRKKAKAKENDQVKSDNITNTAKPAAMERLRKLKSKGKKNARSKRAKKTK